MAVNKIKLLLCSAKILKLIVEDSIWGKGRLSFIIYMCLIHKAADIVL